MSSSALDQALAGAQFEGVPAFALPNSSGRTALLLGANGRLGEQLLASLSSNAAYSRIDVATVANIEMGVASVRARRAAQFEAIDDVFINISAGDDAFGSSYYGRDAAFLSVGEADVEALISVVVALKAKRLALIRPMSAYQQMGGIGAALIEPYEYVAHKSKLESVLICRPTPLVEPTKAVTFAQKLFGGYLSLNRFAMPKSFEPIRSSDAAMLFVDLLANAQPGLVVLAADQLRARLEAQRTADRAAQIPKNAPISAPTK